MDTSLKIAIVRTLQHDHVIFLTNKPKEALCRLVILMKETGLFHTFEGNQLLIRELGAIIEVSSDRRHRIGHNRKAIIADNRTPTKRDEKKWELLIQN